MFLGRLPAGAQAFVGLLPALSAVRMIRVGTSAHPTGGAADSRPEKAKAVSVFAAASRRPVL